MDVVGCDEARGGSRVWTRARVQARGWGRVQARATR